MNPVLDAVASPPAGQRPRGITSVCSAHPLVIEATMRQALADGSAVLIEATSNQVDQFGGYTGLRPADFRVIVENVAGRVGLPLDRLVLGGDHLGPNRWRDLNGSAAMAHAEDLIRSYVAAGYAKLHLDCSYRCADDDAPLTDDMVAERTTRLLEAAESEAERVGATGRLRYVIGTEVPTPGGADHQIDTLRPTDADAARATLRQHRQAFTAAGLGHVWPQVMALVVQPGVEFDNLHVIDYDPVSTEQLRAVLDDEPTMTFEAHSTDYQRPEALWRLVADGWRVLKVGPALTFAMRESLFALAAIEDDLVAPGARSELRQVVEWRMLAAPEYWERYGAGTPVQQRIARMFSYSDRVRYYWTDAKIDTAVHTLFANLDATGIPEPMLSAYLPEQYARVRAGLISATPKDVVLDHIQSVLRSYGEACTQDSSHVPPGLTPCR
ncbi:D-tagatose-bisphosphate aldolase, class II, non-catalytic subunit [Mycolicibacterium sp. CH28]|uniref:D-tagatose-bisphosphate aldolase, class II, non-catalytic subunit n=1 Tax=Mycolicibacterium sp. CH28 TaxID=2512237 RepID=UPI001F304469|nr:D-tagatose-bisphosphate aldolase, class II, non-catalytic subunit [Mycolicibacterium sp. CH28]